MNSTPDPTRDALYAAILAHPDEDTPRLVYADHIEENGDSARAEFIRLQCRLAAMDEWDDGFTAADVRCRRLLAEHPEWLEAVRPFTGVEALAGSWGESVFRRGFAEYGEWPSTRFGSAADDALRSIPLRSAAVHAFGHHALPAEQLLRCTALARLRSLTLGVERDAFAALATAPPLSTLERLRVQVYAAEVPLLKALAESPHLRNLRAFAFRFTGGHGGNFADANERWDWFPHLRELSLGHYGLHDEFYPRLFATGAWRRLERLSIPAGHDAAGRSVFAVLTGSRLPNLIDLAVDRAQVSPETLAPLSCLDRPPLRSLRLPHLQPYFAARPREAADGLFHAPWLRELRLLGLTSANLLGAWVTSVADAPMAQTLRALDLAGAVFEPRAYQTAFGPKRKWPELQRLNLWFTKCPEDVLTALIDHPGLTNLVSLTAGQGQPAPKFLTRLAESPASARFRELDLSVKMDDATAAALYRSPHLENVDFLKVIKGTAGRTACNRLTRRFGPRLTIESNR